jgi:hypothetical protein
MMETPSWMDTVAILIVVQVAGLFGAWAIWRWNNRIETQPVEEEHPSVRFVITGFEKPLDEVRMMLPFFDGLSMGWGDAPSEDWIYYAAEEDEINVSAAARILVGKVYACREAFSRACGDFKCHLNLKFKSEEERESFFLSEESMRNLQEMGATIGISVESQKGN